MAEISAKIEKTLKVFSVMCGVKIKGEVISAVLPPVCNDGKLVESCGFEYSDKTNPLKSTGVKVFICCQTGKEKEVEDMLKKEKAEISKTLKAEADIDVPLWEAKK